VAGESVLSFGPTFYLGALSPKTGPKGEKSLHISTQLLSALANSYHYHFNLLQVANLRVRTIGLRVTSGSFRTKVYNRHAVLRRSHHVLQHDLTSLYMKQHIYRMISILDYKSEFNLRLETFRVLFDMKRK
jgi:hypothetical protein